MKLIILAVVIAVSIIATNIKEAAKKKRLREQNRRVRVPEGVWPYEPVRRAEGVAPVPQAPALPPLSAAAAEEGQRVTADLPPVPAAPRRRRHPLTVPPGGMRQAFIWSEIFRRRF